MPAPTNTYDSTTNLSLGNIPQVEDPEVYQALLDVHNAIETLLTSSDDGNAVFTAYIAKRRNNTAVSGNYTVLVTDGTIEVDASAGNVIVTLHLISAGIGYSYQVKRVDTGNTNTVTLVGDSSGTPQLIDGHAAGIDISCLSSYTVKTNEAQDGWNIL